MSQQIYAVKCERCKEDISKEKASSVTSKKNTLYFCDNCFKSVFKFDASMKTINMIWEENGKRFPMIVRSNNWHKSSYMKIKDYRNVDSPTGKKKQAFIGDMYLRGELKEQDRPVGKSNQFLWFAWSEELAHKYKEEPRPEQQQVEAQI
jgi:hypothetical protein